MQVEYIEYIFGLLMFSMGVTGVYVFLERLFNFKRLDIDRFKTRWSLERELTRNIHLLASIASNAPYVGLLGTVFGVIYTFHVVATDGMADIAQVMEGLALTLKMTAFGLMVAIPSVFLYNHLLRKIEELILIWEDKNESKEDR